MLRLTMAMVLFVAITVGQIAAADPAAPAPSAPATEATSSPNPDWKPENGIRDGKAGNAARWAPKQARRQEEFGPFLREYPAILTPTGIASFQF